MFNRDAFYAAFEGKLNALATAEKITKETLRDLSRDLLHVLYETEDVSFINRTIAVLTPINKKVARLFFKEFSGFHYHNEEQIFTKKDKKAFGKIAEDTLALLNEDPHFNIWTWADKNIEVEAKPLDLKKITTFVTNALKKAEAEGISKADVFKAMMAGGFEANELIDILTAMA